MSTEAETGTDVTYPAWIVLLHGEEAETFIKLIDDDDEQYRLHAFASEKEALAYYEDSFHANHRRSAEASASACIHFISFQPRAVKVDSLEHAASLAELDEDGLATPLSLSHVSGHYLVLKASEAGKKAWEDGKSPKLIDQNRLNNDALDDAEKLLREHGRL